MTAETLQPSSIPALAPKVVMQTLGPDEGGVLLKLDSGEMYTVNDTTLDFLRRIDGKRTIASIVEELTASIDVDAETLTADLIEITGELRKEALVVTGR